MLDQLIRSVRAGESRVLVVHGDPGVGKTALLDYLAGRASGAGCRVARVAGVQSEMELAFAGLHQLCAPMLNSDGQLPAPQRDALRTAFGLAPGPPPDRFFTGLAVLTVLCGVARDRPLICVVDDEQWLDRDSAQALGFVARRLAAGTLTTSPVGLVFATREPGEALTGLPELVVAGLRDDHARELLESALAGPLDAQVRDLIIAETRGNPLALLELPRGLAPAELAGGFGLPGAAPLTVDPARDAERILAAAQANLQAGAFGKALELLATAETGPLDDFASARVDLLRGQIVFASGLGSDAPALLLKAAKRLEPLNVDLARETYLSAWMAALFAGRLAGAGDLLEVCRAARALPPPAEPPRTVDLVLEGLALIVTDGPTAAGPTLQRAVGAFASADITPEEALRS